MGDGRSRVKRRAGETAPLESPILTRSNQRNDRTPVLRLHGGISLPLPHPETEHADGAAGQGDHARGFGDGGS